MYFKLHFTCLFTVLDEKIKYFLYSNKQTSFLSSSTIALTISSTRLCVIACQIAIQVSTEPHTHSCEETCPVSSQTDILRRHAQSNLRLIFQCSCLPGNFSCTQPAHGEWLSSSTVAPPLRRCTAQWPECWSAAAERSASPGPS